MHDEASPNSVIYAHACTSVGCFFDGPHYLYTQ